MDTVEKMVYDAVFSNIYKDMNKWEVKDEVEEFNLFINLIKNFGFNFNPKCFLILNRRGEMQRQRLKRCNMRKKFKRDTNKKYFFDLLYSLMIS